MSKAPKNGRKGVDAWTNNGMGLKSKPVISKKQAEKINKTNEVKKK